MNSDYLFILIIALVVILIVMFRSFQRKSVENELKRANRKLGNQKKILQSTIETQEIERKRIAQDLHDAISAKLNVVNLHANMLKDGSLSKQEQQDSLDSIVRLTQKVLTSSREIAHDLLPPILDKFGLVAALDELIDEFSSAKLEIDKQIVYEKRLTKSQELHVFRILQEVFNNALKHGNASKINLSLMDNEDEFKLICSDNGSGFVVK